MFDTIATSQGNIAIFDSQSSDKNLSSVVIFIHGHCTDKGFFSHQYNSLLLANYRLIGIDLPGYGESDPAKEPENVYSFPGFADVVCELINKLNLQNVVIVGWSLGGHVALELTSKLPQLKGILITGAPPIEVSLEGLSQGFKIADPKIQECFGKGNLSLEEAKLFATISGYNYSEEKKFIVDAILKADEHVKVIYPQSILKGIGQDERKIVREWSRPIAVIAGKDDSGINNDYIIHEVEFANLWRNQVHVIANAGHAVFMEQPAEFNRLLKAFLDDLNSSSSSTEL